jgi:hypothetical protein
VEKLSLGMKPDGRDHRHVSRPKAFEISGDPKFGRIVALLGSSATKENPAPAGCFVEVDGVIEHVHLRKSTKPKVDFIHRLGERIAAELKKAI